MGKVAINIATGSLLQEEIIVGIDLGTTNSLIAIVKSDTHEPIALREIDGLTLVPSIVHFDEYGNVTVGNPAKDLLVKEPERTIYSAKRLMGKSYKDVSHDAGFFAYNVIDDGTDALVKVQVGDKFYSPIELSSYILKELKKRAEHILKTTVSKAVITVPAYFNDAQRQATRDAGRLAGLDVLRIINEPTAASLAYGLGAKAGEDKTIAVYDLGGGTFDISILTISAGIFEVLATNGDTYLGGDDMDNLLVRYWQEDAGVDGTSLGFGSHIDKSLAQQMRVTAEEAKKHLTNNEVFEGTIDGKAVRITREEFNELIQPLIDRTITSCANALRDAGLTVDQIDAVVMVGGSTRVPLVKESVKNFFGRDVHDKLNPDEVVALGAAVQADILAGNNTEMLLLDVTPLSLGIETMGGLMDVLVPRNSKIPTKAGRQYTTQKDGQSGMRISVFQGERDMVQDNRKLAEFNLSGIPAMPAGLPKVEVTFLLDADGILKVSATELRSGVATSIDVQPKYGLTDEAVEQMLIDSLTNAKDDIKLRALTEATTEAIQMLDTTEKFISKHRDILTEEEVNKTLAGMQNLRYAIDAKDKDKVQHETEALNEVSRPYAERVMDAALKDAMRGKKIL
ncbi:heat-shock protein Hsp70 [Flavipsychrobacter stenotrophus]|uniref:Heat-shock protein Hsp70 n=1 Tax=Flavipsychrobacter stenotrophus TaxID=2077091 RepID=A0A2S7SYN9_9BACT|nr:Fe-S protein assembly chaperone HscA [Flavipsychrobacter stenotrophus]PQJ11727.1 heat-shock protein Hsp70 [Flavipsychrobacter stenotrophus]